MTILAARGIRKSYAGREVVAGVDLELERGECYWLLGRWPEGWLFHVLALAAYGVVGFLFALRMFRRRLMS